MASTEPVLGARERVSWLRTVVLVWVRSMLSFFVVSIPMIAFLNATAASMEEPPDLAVLYVLPFTSVLAPVVALPFAAVTGSTGWALALIRRAYSAVVSNLFVTVPTLVVLGLIWLILYALWLFNWVTTVLFTCAADPLWSFVGKVLPSALPYSLATVWFNPYVMVVWSEERGCYEVTAFSRWWHGRAVRVPAHAGG